MTAPAGRSIVRSLAAPFAATVVALAILISLGLWQLDRKAWKEGLIAQIQARAFEEPAQVIPESDWPSWRQEEGEYRRVRLAGTFLPDKLVAVHGLAELRERQATQGFYLFVPLRREDGSTVMVNRGFVPTELRDRTIADLRAAPSSGAVVGLVRAPETRGSFVPENDPARDVWFVRSLDDMARARGLSRLAPFYVDADATPNPGGWPKGGQTQLTLRNHHLQYAFTWFGLALTLVGVFAAFAAGRIRSRNAPSPGGGGSDRRSGVG